jgi:hypothetical protein
MGMLAAQGCVIVSGTGGNTGGSSGVTSGSHTTSGSDTTSGTYTTTTSTGVSTASGVLPSSCDAAAGDDTCVACQKKSCCAELQACSGDAACKATYGVYGECLYPGGGDASGYTSTYCQAVAGENSPAGKKAADAYITCLTSTCGNDTACGTPETVTWDNFAADFTENFCTGCHFPGFFDDNTGKSVNSGDPATDIPQFTDDADWQYWPWPQDFAIGPKANATWKTDNKKDKVAAVAKKIWCGVSVTLPDTCAADFPGHFPTAQRFPPPGGDPSVTMKAACIWNEGGTCPQPTDAERNKMASWVFDGTP